MGVGRHSGRPANRQEPSPAVPLRYNSQWAEQAIQPVAEDLIACTTSLVPLPRKLTDNASGVTPPAANAKIPDIRVLGSVLHGTAVLSPTAFQE